MYFVYLPIYLPSKHTFGTSMYILAPLERVKMTPKFIAWLLILTLLARGEAKVPAIIVFGDSSVDAGNNNFIPTVARSNFSPYGRDFYNGKATGRFSNGRVPTDFISAAFGLRPMVPAYLDPSYNISDFAVGVSFASAGSGYDSATSDVLSVISLSKQLDYFKDHQKKLRAYLGVEKANKIFNKALYVMSLGTNDFMENFYTMPDRSSQYTVDQYQNYLIKIAKNFTESLYGLGARKISLGGIPPMGCLPLERATNYGSGNECQQSYNTVAENFNGKLKGVVQQVNKELNGARVVLSDPYPMLMEIVKKPSSFGFTSPGVACCATGMFEMGYACDRYNPFTCTDAKKYVFWDAFHPTEKTSQIIVQHLMKTSLAQFL